MTDWTPGHERVATWVYAIVIVVLIGLIHSGAL